MLCRLSKESSLAAAVVPSAPCTALTLFRRFGGRALAELAGSSIVVTRDRSKEPTWTVTP